MLSPQTETSPDPLLIKGDTNVVLTATLSKGAVTNTKSFTLTVIALAITDAAAVSNASNALVIGYSGSDNATNVTANVMLVTNATNGVSITWSSSNTNVIAINGDVTRPSFNQGDTNVVLTATLSKGAVTNMKSFTLTVIALAITDAAAVSNASNALVIGYSGSDSATNVTANVMLVTNATNGVSITWSSSNTNVIATNGDVTRPSFNQGDTNVVLTATLSKGAVTNTKSFTLTVIALAITDAAAVSNASNALVIGYSGSDNATNVTANVMLVTNATNGVSITWSSSNTNVIAINGDVTRPSFNQGDTNVVLTATPEQGS